MTNYYEEANKAGLVIEIDEKSGFCFGVSRAVQLAEEHLQKEKGLISLGDIVHNDEEIGRLENSGMQTISLEQNVDLNKKTVLFRAHGEPPSTYQKMAREGAHVLDATCPVVIKLQERVENAWKEQQTVGGQVAIYGNKGHAEVVGLVGQTNGEAVVLETTNDFHLLQPDKPTVLFAQTTKSREGYENIINELRNYLHNPDHLKVHKTICAQVGNRVPHLKEFAPKFDLVLFVAGAKSSNGKALFEVCKGANSNTYFVSSPGEFQFDELEQLPKKVGVCGATSTPHWLMKNVADEFSKEWLDRFNNEV